MCFFLVCLALDMSSMASSEVYLLTTSVWVVGSLRMGSLKFPPAAHKLCIPLWFPGSLGVHSLVQGSHQNSPAHGLKQLTGMLCHRNNDSSSSGHYLVLSRLANAVTPLWRLPYQEQLQVRCVYTDFSLLCCPSCPLLSPRAVVLNILMLQSVQTPFTAALSCCCEG